MYTWLMYQSIYNLTSPSHNIHLIHLSTCSYPSMDLKCSFIHADIPSISSRRDHRAKSYKSSTATITQAPPIKATLLVGFRFVLPSFHLIQTTTKKQRERQNLKKLKFRQVKGRPTKEAETHLTNSEICTAKIDRCGAFLN